MATADLVYRFIAKDVNTSTTCDLIADALTEISTTLRKLAVGLREIQVSEADETATA